MVGEMILNDAREDRFNDEVTRTDYIINDLFERSLSRGFLRKLWSGLTHRSIRRLGKSDFSLHFKSSYYAGVRVVAIDRILGSEGINLDFDDRFYPQSQRTRQRWKSIAKAFFLGIELPPVDLIQVGDHYYVRDGHHRISVARAFGQNMIDAEITVWKTD